MFNGRLFHLRTGAPAHAAAIALGLFSLIGCEGGAPVAENWDANPSDGGAAGQTGGLDQALANGSPVNNAVRPAIGQVAGLVLGCTATLIGNRYVLTAAHCNWHKDTFTGTPTFTAGGATKNVSRIFIIGAEEHPGAAVPPNNTDLNPDVAILELASAFPAANAVPIAISSAVPNAGVGVDIYGFGPNNAACDGTSRRRVYNFDFGDFTSQFCPGDSGGPGVLTDPSADNGPIWGVASFTPSSGDVWGDVSHFKEDIMSVIRMWQYSNGNGITGLEAAFKRNGVLLDTRSGTSSSGCRDLCNADSRCNSFTHTTSTSSCRLMRSAGDWVPDSDSTSGLSSTNRFEVDIDRPGHDYSTFTASLDACSLQCSGASRCAAFAWRASTSLCHLKDYLGLSVIDAGVTSGTKRGFEFYTDRPGSDIDDFDTGAADVRKCQSACSDDPDCLAYTYRKQLFDNASPPHVTSPGHCWMKNAVPARVTNVTDPPGGQKRLISGLWRSTP